MAVKNILRAFAKLLKNENEGLSKKRLRICNVCPDRAGMVCGACGCYLKAKTREPDEECPLGHWPKVKEPEV